MYFIVDLENDYRSFMGYDDLKQLLIEKVMQDIENNLDNKEIILNNSKIMRRLAEEKYTTLSFIEDALESFMSYKIIDLQQLQRDLIDLREFTGEEHLINAVIKLIER